MKNLILQFILLGTIATGLVNGPDYSHVKKEKTPPNMAKRVKLSGKIVNQDSKFVLEEQTTFKTYPIVNLPASYKVNGLQVEMECDIKENNDTTELSVTNIGIL